MTITRDRLYYDHKFEMTMKLIKCTLRLRRLTSVNIFDETVVTPSKVWMSVTKIEKINQNLNPLPFRQPFLFKLSELGDAILKRRRQHHGSYWNVVIWDLRITTETLLKITSNVGYVVGLLQQVTRQRGRRGCCATVGKVVGVLA